MYATEKRVTSTVSVKIRSGTTTAPVARTTPKSTVETPKKTNVTATMRLACTASGNAGEPAGKKSASAARPKISTKRMSDPVNRKL